MLTRFLRYTAKVAGIICGILIILYLIAFIYISVNKKSIIKDVTEKIGKQINGRVSIGDVELSFFRTFPKASVLLHNVLVTDTMYQQHHRAFFEAKEVYAELSELKLLQRKSSVSGLKIEMASIYLYTDTSGYTNAYLLKPKKDSSVGSVASGNQKNDLNSIELKDVRVIVDDRKREKLYDIVADKLKVKINDGDSVTLLSAKANLLIHSLAFNLSNGTFLKEKKFEGDFDFKFDKKKSQLQFDSIDVRISEQPFNLSGRFDIVQEDPQFTLGIHVHNIQYSFAKSLLPAKVDTAMSIVDVVGELSADANISGPLNGGDPLVLIAWKANKTQLKTPFFDFDKASFTGFYTNEMQAGKPRRDPNSKIAVNNFSAEWNGLPVSSTNIEILNLYQPLLSCDLASEFPLKDLNDIIGSTSILLESGHGSISLTYKGPIEKNNNTNSFLNGVVSFKDGNVLYEPRGVELKNVNGRLLFKNSDVIVEKLQCSVLNNKIVMDGEAKNLLTLINSEPNKAKINWNIYSPSLNLSSFTYLLKSRKQVSTNTSSKNTVNKMANNIDNVLDQGSLHVNLHAQKLFYKKFEAINTTADVTLLPDRYLINNVSMEHAGGHINFSGSIISQKENNHTATVNAIMDNVDVNKIFEAFNNFGQDGIEAKNLEGKLDANVKASLELDDEGNAYSKSIASIIDFSLKNGALNNFDPVKKIQSFIFKKRDFDNIRFAELKDKLEVANQEIKINKMEIESNVISMYVEGLYSMKGNTLIRVQVPLSNLKKRGDDYVPENKGVDAKTGPSLFLRGRPGADGKIQFKPELLHLFRKSKNN